MKIPEIIKLTDRKLRFNITKAEIILWKFIRKEFLEYKFLRQKPIYVYTENNYGSGLKYTLFTKNNGIRFT